MNNKEESDDNTYSGQVPLVAAEQVLLTLSFNQEVQLERKGKKWHDVSNQMSAHQLEQIVRSWQQTEASVFKTLPLVNQANGIDVTLGLADNDIRFSAYPAQDALYLYHHQKDIWLQLPPAFIQQLIPTSILSVKEPV